MLPPEQGEASACANHFDPGKRQEEEKAALPAGLLHAIGRCRVILWVDGTEGGAGVEEKG